MLKGVTCPDCRTCVGHTAVELRSHMQAYHGHTDDSARDLLRRALGRTDSASTPTLRRSSAARRTSLVAPAEEDGEDDLTRLLYSGAMNG